MRPRPCVGVMWARPLNLVIRCAVILSIHSSLLHDCPMFRSCSEECAKTILLKARPQVCLQKESLIEPGALCTELYILMTGV